MHCRQAAVIGAFVLAASGAGAAWSQDHPWYVGVGVGTGDFREACERIPAGSFCDSGDVTKKVFGGYRMGQLLFEAGYSNLGKAEVQSSSGGGTFQAKAWEFTVGIFHPLLERLALHGRWGFYRAKTTLNSSVPFAGFSTAVDRSDSNGDMVVALGLLAGLGERVAGRLEWQRYNGVGGSKTLVSDLEVLSLGVAYSF